MHIGVISGSHRKISQSRKVAGYIAERLPKIDADTTTDIIDLTGNPLPLYDEGANDPQSPTGKVWPGFSKRFQAAEAFGVVTPEWHGMVPSGVKNIFLHTGMKEVGHKPALIVAVSASRGGSYPVAELRMSSYKNSRILYIPEHILVQYAEKVLNGPESESPDDAYIRERIDFALRILLSYGQALKDVRAAGVTENSKFRNGM